MFNSLFSVSLDYYAEKECHQPFQVSTGFSSPPLGSQIQPWKNLAQSRRLKPELKESNEQCVPNSETLMHAPSTS